MSLSMNDIKNKIVATQNMSKITKAMQMVSVSKLGRAEARLMNYRENMSEFYGLLSTIQKSEYTVSHPFVKPTSNVNKTAYIVVTTNRGLVGGYNNNLFKVLESKFRSSVSDVGKLYVIGQKGSVYVKNAEIDVDVERLYMPDEPSYQDVLELVNKLIADYLNGAISSVVVLYQDFVSKMVQEPKEKVLLPLVMDENPEPQPAYLISPDEPTLVHKILMNYVGASIYEGLLNANLSEHAARMNAMQNATDNAEEIIKDSQLIYNRARQAAITQEISEIVAGSNAVN